MKTNWGYNIKEFFEENLNKVLDKFKKKRNAPWHKYFTKEERKFNVPNISIYDQLKENCEKYSELYAYTYFNKQVTYKKFLRQIDECAASFRYYGIKQGDVVTICSPNIPEAVISFYALNKIGAIANMIHPLSSEVQIRDYLIDTNSVMLVMIDVFFDKIKKIINDTSVYKVVVLSAKDSMRIVMKFAYQIAKGVKVIGSSFDYIFWNEFIKIKTKDNLNFKAKIGKRDAAVIMHSGGTTGKSKGIVLSNESFVALALQARVAFKDIHPSDKILAVLPIFHGFGLGVSIHAPFSFGGNVILVPQFNYKKFDSLLIKHDPQILFAVPTLYENLISSTDPKLNLKNLKHLVSGGDTISDNKINEINSFLKSKNSKATLSQGYGMTECLAASAVGVGKYNKIGSIGIPLIGNFYKIVTPETQEDVGVNIDGEICISGPSVMMGYLNNEVETNKALQIHKDGHLWLHTGDMGYMDSDGVFFYKQRLKRMIISSGYNIYPREIEEVLLEHPDVLSCSVIGIPHEYKGEVAKAVIVLKNDSKSLFVKNSIKAHCKKYLSEFAVPYVFEFRKSLPKTLIGKIDFKKLESEE